MCMSFLFAAVLPMAVLSCSDVNGEPDSSVGERVIAVQERLEIDYDAERFSLDVEANFDFEVESLSEWIGFEKAEGGGARYGSRQRSTGLRTPESER